MIKIPNDLIGKELYAFLMLYKTELIQQKCAFPRKSEPYNCNKLSVKEIRKNKTTSNKIAGEQTVVIDDNGEVDVVVIANAANFIDCQMDLLLPDCWKKTIKESGPTGKNRIYHLKDHKQNTDGVIGKVSKLYSEDHSLVELGLDMVGSTQCLVMESTVKEALCDKCFDMYSDKMINQHSIGIQYVKMDIAINDPNYPTEFAIWNKYFMQCINKDVATSVGYFWVIYEIKLMEVSAVLWGANELTPTIHQEELESETYMGSGAGKSKPPKGTEHKEPIKVTQEKISEMISKAKINIHI